MPDLVGIGLAILAAVGLAVMVISVRLGTDSGRSNDALVVVLLVNVFVLVPTTIYVVPSPLDVTLEALLAFTVAGLAGTMMGRAFYFAGIERIGASRAGPIKGSMPLFATVIAVLVLGETLTVLHAVGILMIVTGVAYISWGSRGQSSPLDEDVDLRGLALPVLAAFFFGVEPTFAKIGFSSGTPVLVGLTIKTLTATLGFAAYLTWRDALPDIRGSSLGNVRWYLLAGIANTVFLLSYYTALDAAPVVLVVPIQQTSPMIVVVLSYLFLQRLERVTWRLGVAAVFIVSGATAVSIFG